MAARLFQQIIEDVIGSSDEGDTFLSYYSNDDDYTEDDRRRRRRRRGRSGGGGGGGRSSSHRRRRRNDERGGSSSSSRRHRSRDYDRDDDDGDDDGGDRRNQSKSARRSRSRRARDDDDDNDEGEPSLSSSEGDGASDWTSATSGTGLSSSVYDRHRRRNHRSQSRSGRDRDRDRDRDRERRRRRRQEERRAAEEAAAAAEAEAEAEAERQRQRERRLERELQQREQERLEREREWREHAARAQKQQQQYHHSRQGQQQRYRRTASAAEEEDTAGSLTRAVEDGIERSRHHHQHHHQHQPPPRGDQYRNAELDRQRQKKERQESIERLIQEQGGELLVIRKHGANVGSGNPYGDHRQQRDEEVSCLTTPTALEGMAGGVGKHIDGTTKAQQVTMMNAMQSIGEEDDYLHRHSLHQRRPSVGGDGGNGTGKHPWPCDPTATDYSPQGNGVRDHLNYRDVGGNAARGINIRSTSVDEYDATSKRVPQRAMMASQSFDVGDTSAAAVRRPGGTFASPSSRQPGVRIARSFDRSAPPTNDGVGAHGLHGLQHQLPPKPPKQLPRPYDQLREEHQGSNQQQMIIEEAQQILSPYYQKRDTMQQAPPPPPPPPPPTTSRVPHLQSRPPQAEPRPPVAQEEYLHRTNPLSPIKHKVQPLTSSMPNGLPLPGQAQPVQSVPWPSCDKPNHQDHNKSPSIPVTPNGPMPDDSAALVSPDISTGDADVATAAAAIDGSESPDTKRRRDSAEAAAAAAAALKAIKRQARSGRAKSAPKERSIRKTLSIDWTQNLWSPCEEEEDAEPSVFASPNYVPYWHCHIGNALESTSSRKMGNVLHEMMPLDHHGHADSGSGFNGGRDTATPSHDVVDLVEMSVPTHSTIHNASPVTTEDTSNSQPLPLIVGTDVESTQCQSAPDSTEESLDESLAPPDPSMIGAMDVSSVGDEHQHRSIAPDPPSGVDPTTHSTQKVLLDPPTDTSFRLLSDMSMDRIEVRPLEPLEQEHTATAHEANRCNDGEEGVEVVRKMTSDSDCLRAIALSTPPPIDDDISDDEEPGKIRSVPSMVSDAIPIGASPVVVNVSDDEGSSPGRIRAVPSVDPDARDTIQEEGPGYIRAVPSLDPDEEDLTALAQHHILTIDTTTSLDLGQNLIEEEAPEDAILAFRETMESSDDESRVGEDVERTSSFSADDAAATQIQKLVRGVQTRHRILAQMGIAKRRKWEPRTKTQDQTRIHSDIRRAARSYLRHRALVLDTPGPGSMALAVRRVCAIRIQRWFLHQAAFYRKMWTSITGFQALARGHLQRKRYEKVLEQQSRPKVVKNRPLDAFTAVIRIQAWVRSTIIRRAYVHEHRLRASYTDIQWDKKKEGARNRILALVPASDGHKSKTDTSESTWQDDPAKLSEETKSHSSRAHDQSTPYKSSAVSVDPSPISMATAALTDLERTLEEAREARDLSGLSVPYVSDAPDSSYENSYVSPHRLFDSGSPDRLEIDEDKEWATGDSLPNEWHPKRFDTHSTMLSNDGQGQIVQDDSANSNAETSSLLAAARSSRLKRMKGKLSSSRFGTSTTNDNNLVAQRKGQSTTRSENNEHRMKHAAGTGDATSVTSTRGMGRPPSGNARQQYDDPPLSMPMESFDEDDDAEGRQFHVTIDSNGNPFLNTSDVSALTNDIPMRRQTPTRRDFVTDNDTNFLVGNPSVEHRSSNDAAMEEFF